MTDKVMETERFKARTEEQIKTLFSMRSEFRQEMQERISKIEVFQKIEIVMLLITIIGMFLNLTTA